MKIGLKISFILLCVMIASLGLYLLYLKEYRLPYELPKNIFILPSIKDKYSLVLLGNSHADEGVIFVRYGLNSLKLTDPAQSFEWELANLKMHRNQIADNAVVVIDVSQISFLQKTATREDAYQTQFYDGRMSPFLIPHLKIEDYVQSQIFPFLRAGFLWRKRNGDIIRERISAEERRFDTTTMINNIAAKPTVQTGVTLKNIGNDYFNVDTINKELASPSALSSPKLTDSMNFIFNKWYRTAGFGKQYFASNRGDLEKLILYCLHMKWRPVLITIPVSQILLTGMLPDFMRANVYDNVHQTNLHGVQYFDFTDVSGLIRDTSLWRDSDHLNGNGQAVFSYLLLQKLITNGYLPKQVDQYTRAMQE